MEQLDLSDFFKTKAQANDFSTRLSTISQSIYQTDFDLDKALMEQFGIQRKDTFITLLRDNNIAINSGAVLKGFIDEIQKKIALIPILSLSLAFEPKEETLRSLSEWFLINTNKQFLFDIHVEPNLVAGAVIFTKGKFLDFSVKQRFDQILQDMLSQKTQTAPSEKEATETTPQETHQNSENINLGR